MMKSIAYYEKPSSPYCRLRGGLLGLLHHHRSDGSAWAASRKPGRRSVARLASKAESCVLRHDLCRCCMPACLPACLPVCLPVCCSVMQAYLQLVAAFGDRIRRCMRVPCTACRQTCSQNIPSMHLHANTNALTPTRTCMDTDIYA
jgi:hypothetical protein